MTSAEKIKEFAKKLSIPAVGICSAETDGVLLERLKNHRNQYPVCEFEEPDLLKRTEPNLLLRGAKSFVVCMFPYYSKALGKGNLSLHAQVPDYHTVVNGLLQKLGDYICHLHPETNYQILCDTSPLSDRMLAYRAGLGFFGKNHMLIHPVYGSYCVIGSLLLDLPLPADRPLEQTCLRCDACIRACPGQALLEDFGFNCERCVSYLTQKKTLTEEQQSLVRGQSSVYGCDVCQSVCPHNRDLADTPIYAFRENCISSLNYDELRFMSGNAYKKKYKDYTFAWRSKQVLLKNFYQEEDRS